MRCVVRLPVITVPAFALKVCTRPILPPTVLTPALGVLGVSVGEVAQVDACRQLPSCRQLPVQQESQIDIGIDLRTDDLIAVIIVIIIRMPTK